MKVERVEPKKKKRPNTNWVGRVLIIALLGVAGFTIWKLKTAPLPGVVETQLQTVSPVQRSLPYKPESPIAVDSDGQRFAIPLTQGKHITNILIYHLALKDRRLLFNEPVIITSIQKTALTSGAGLAITVVKEDTNSNGTLDRDDIRELVWFNGDTGVISTIKRSLFSFIRMVPTPIHSNLVFEVRVDINRNGRSESTDPKQFVVIELPDTVHDMLPESVVPTLSIPTRDNLPINP